MTNPLTNRVNGCRCRSLRFVNGCRCRPLGYVNGCRCRPLGFVNGSRCHSAPAAERCRALLSAAERC